MTTLPTLDPEIADLGLAIGLLTSGGGGVQLDSGWFDDPGGRLAGALASDQRRSALVRFAEAVLANGTHTERDGVTLLPLFDLRELAGDDTLPDLTLQVALDARPADYTEVGLAMTLATSAPVTRTDAVIPLYRAAKAGKSVAEPFALLAGATVQLATDITVSTAQPAPDEFGLAGVAVAVETAVAGTPTPTFRLQLKGLHLPGAAAPTDIQVGGPGVDIEDALLSLVLGVVRQAVDAGGGGSAARDVLDLLGLGDAGAIPALPVDDLLAHGAAALRDWFAELMGAEAARTAWLAALAGLVGGSAADGRVQIPIGAGPVRATVGIRAEAGPGGHLQVTPRLGVSLATEVAGSISLAGEAVADLFTIDVADGSLHPVPRVEVVVTASGNGADDAAKLLHTGTLDVRGLRLGMKVVGGAAQSLIELLDVGFGGTTTAVLDLSSPDAAAASLGQVAATLIGNALAALGDAGAELKVLLGLDPPAGVTALDAARLLTDPLGALREWWQQLTADHAADVPAVLLHLLNLVAAPLQQAQQSIPGSGTAEQPWSVPIGNRISVDCWRDGDAFVLAPTLSLRVSDLAGGCTTVLTTVRAELARLDLVGGHAAFLTGVDFTTRLRNTGETAATLSLGAVALTADFVGVRAAWSPTGGLGLQFLAPNSSAIVGDVRVPLALPTVDADGHLDVPPESWESIESLIAVLASGGRGWLSDLVDLTGWSIEGGTTLLSLAELVSDPAAALRDWVLGLLGSPDGIQLLADSLAHLTGGSADGLAGLFTGSGTPDDPWLVTLGPTTGLPAVAVWLTPDGPVHPAARAGGAIQGWRPGDPGLPDVGLANALAAEGPLDPDLALMAAGRTSLAAGLTALAGRWVGTDGFVAPPTPAVPGLTTVVRPDLPLHDLAATSLDAIVPGGVPAGTVVVRVAVSAVADLPWPAPAGRTLDLTAPGLAPESFSVDGAAPGEWVVALASCGDTSLGAGDPSGVLGQAARLQRVVSGLAAAGPVELVALAGAGHAARLVADAVPGVSTLVTLGAPWSAVTFDSYRTGGSAEALRVLRALMPPPDDAEPDDPDLAAARGLVGGSFDAARAKPYVADLEAPRPATGIRAGLTAIGVFGTMTEDAVRRALTAVFAAGLATRAQARLGSAENPPTGARIGLRLPFALTDPPGGHGITVTGAVALGLAGIDLTAPTLRAAPSVRVDLEVADTDQWLIGGPGTAPVAGAAALELRRLSARVDVGLHGGASSARILLGEGSALGADWTALLVEPPAAATGEIEVQPLLPEARALLNALTGKLGALPTGSPAGVLLDLLKALGVSQADGALVPDALAQVLHDPGGRIRGLVAESTGRAAVLDALHGLLPDLVPAGDQVQVAVGPLTVSADLATRTVSCTVTVTGGLITVSGSATLGPGGPPTGQVTLGDPAHDAFALRVETGPLRVALARPPGLAEVALWPAFDADAVTRLAIAALPAEALRLVLEGLRRIDYQLGTTLDDLMSALGMLTDPDPDPDGDGLRAVRAPVLLFEHPARWFAQAGVLSVLDGGPLDADKVIDLLEGIKPFVGAAGAPRGTWPIVDGVQVTVAATSAGPALTLAVDATTWLAGAANRPAVAAGFSVGLTLPASGAPRPSAEVFLGVPDGPNGTSTPQHRRTAHVTVDPSAIRVFLRAATGSDLEIYPNPAGFASILEAGVTELLPFALDELTKLSGDATRTAIADLVTATGRGLALASDATPAVFDKSALRSLAADPAAYLRAHIAEMLTQVVGALDPLLRQILTAASAVATVDGAGVLTISFRTFVVSVRPAPFAVSVTGSVTGLPIVGSVEVSVSADAAGLSAWSAGVGPAELDLGGPVVRPFVRAGSQHPAGWQVEAGLGLDDLAPTATNHAELFARWRESDSALTVVATTRTGPATVVEDTSPAGVAEAAVDAVLDLVGGWVLGVPEITALLQKAVGTKTVGFVLQDAVLDKTAPPTAPRLVSGVLTGWPGKLFTLASNLAAAAPKVTVDVFTFAVTKDSSGVLGVAVSTADAAGIDLTGGGALSLRLEVDASWIEPPSGSPPAPGIVLNLLTLSGQNFTVTPGVEVNGVGLRLGKGSGPLIDAGLRLDTVAVHVFGSVQLGTGPAPAFAGGIEVELGGLAVPLGGGGGDNAVAQGIMHDAGGSGAPPRPAFSPSVAVQDHGTGVAVTLRAGPDPGPWYLPIQRAFGPVYLEQVGLGVTYRPGVTPLQLQIISLYLDGGVSLLGLSASVDKLRFGYQVGQPFFDGGSWQVDVDGFAISSSVGGLTLAGGLRKFELAAPLSGVEYLGMLKVGYAGYGVDLYGGYAHPSTASGAQFASFFAFGVLHAPIGGPPAFFITGIGIGFGINRELHAPTIDEVNSHPFMLALRATGPTPDPMKQLQDMRALVPPQQGQYWVAAGISFTSFVLITGEILVTVQFGDGLEIAVLGLARTQLPTADLTLVSIELALLARFSSTEGLLLVQAQLTENSWLLDKSVRLTGGFAFATWWKGPNAGQFVVTVGGYHPRFQHSGYPVVPRVGLRWSPIDNISVVGGVYFALCSEAIMAGAAIEVAAHFGPAHARLAFGGDAIVFFDPFWFSVSAYAEVEVGITIWLLFGSVDLDLSFGVAVEISGPPIYVTGHFSVCGFEVPFEFGDKGDPADRALTAAQFEQKYLRGDHDAQVVQAAVVKGAVVAGKAPSGGQDKPPDGSAEHPFRVVPEFVLTYVTTAPVNTVVITGQNAAQKSLTVSAPGLGVAPMYSATLSTTFTMAFARPDAEPFDLTGVALSARPTAAFPKAVWGPAQNPKAATVPAGDTIDAVDGLTIDTVLPDKAGAPPIDYHQIELPLHGRKPLPFVMNRTQTDQRVADALALKTAAQVLTAGSPDTDQRFVRAALMLAAGGSGRSTVAALRGDRAASPSFGSLADDLVDSPDAVSPPVTPVVVDGSKPPPRRFPPLVKSLLDVPLSMSLDRPGTTTVKHPGAAARAVVPSLAAVRAGAAGASQAVLKVVPRTGVPGPATVLPVGVAPLTRLASSAVGAVANAAPAPQSAARLAAMSGQLVDESPGALVHDGELTVITVASRPLGDTLDTLTVTGVPARVICLSAGGLAVADDVVGDGAAMTMPRETERVAVVGDGDQAAGGGTVPGWCSGQSLPSIGWNVALGGGVVVSAQATRVADNRERADGGWLLAADLAAAAQVVTTWTDPVDAVAVVVDDYIGGDAAGALSMRLLDAERITDASGAVLAPKLLVDGVRTILLYAARTTGPEPGVLVDGCGGGYLAGVLGGAAGVDALAAQLASTGVEASVQQPLTGGPGQRRVSITLGDGPVDPTAAVGGSSR